MIPIPLEIKQALLEADVQQKQAYAMLRGFMLGSAEVDKAKEYSITKDFSALTPQAPEIPNNTPSESNGSTDLNTK
jgi:hypothetical protein